MPIPHAIKTDTTRGLAWIRCGIERVQRDPPRWFGLTLVYFLVAVLLTRIPFMGNLVLVLVTPLLLGGVLLVVREPPARAPAASAAGVSQYLRAYLVEPARQLFQLLGQTDRLMDMIMVCILPLGSVLVVGIAEYLLTGGSIVSGLAASELAAPLRLAQIAGIVAVIALYVLLAMALYFLLPLTLFHGVAPMRAMAESFSACRRNAAPLALFAGAYLLPLLAILIGFVVKQWLGYVLVFTLGFALLPAFIAGAYCSYQALYESGSGG